MPRPLSREEVIAAVHDAVLARGGAQHGDEWTFQCVESAAHQRGDQDPSGRWNLTKAVWRCVACGAQGGVVDLAERLGIALTIEDVRPPSLAAFALARAIPLIVLRRFGVEAIVDGNRPALRYPTSLRIMRLKFMDGRKPKYRWAKTGGHAHWYGIRSALASLGALEAAVLYVVNGEPSVWACHGQKVPAVCLCAGEGTAPFENFVRELWGQLPMRTRVRVVYDTDEVGRAGAHRVVAALRQGTLGDVKALDLRAVLPDVAKADVDDLQRRVGTGLAAALAGLPLLMEDRTQAASSSDEMPSDEVAERALVGLLLMPGDRTVLWTDGRLTDALFWDPDLRKLFLAARALVSAGRAVDVVTVADHLHGLGITMASDLLTEAVAFAQTHAPASGEVVALLDRLRYQRDVVRAMKRGLTAALRGGEDFADEVAAVVDAAIGAALGTEGPQVREIPEIVRDVLVKVKARTPGALDGVETGFAVLDRMLRGLQRGGLIIVAARTSLGKSTICQQFAEAIARHGSVLFFSLEMADEELGSRGIARRAGISYLDFVTNDMDGGEWSRAEVAADQLANLSLRIVDTARGGITVDQVAAVAARAALTGPLDAIVVDYLGLLADQQRREESRVDLVQRQTAALKQLARRMNCPVLLVSQVNREPVKRKEKRPQLADLRSSGALEQDADVVLFIHRQGYYEPGRESRQTEEAEVIVAKNRRGPTGTLKLVWVGDVMEFRLPAEDDPTVRDARYEPEERRFVRDANDDLPF